MRTEFIAEMKNLLLSERNTLLSRTKDYQEVDTEGDDTDIIQANMIIEMNNELNSRSVNKIRQINDALKRIEENSYGECVDCGEEIPEKRLLINPNFLTCVLCSESKELGRKR